MRALPFCPIRDDNPYRGNQQHARQLQNHFVLQGEAMIYRGKVNCPAGVEPTPQTLENQPYSKTGGTKSGTLCPELAHLIAVWPTLPPHITSVIKLLARGAQSPATKSTNHAKE